MLHFETIKLKCHKLCSFQIYTCMSVLVPITRVNKWMNMLSEWKSLQYFLLIFFVPLYVPFVWRKSLNNCSSSSIYFVVFFSLSIQKFRNRMNIYTSIYILCTLLCCYISNLNCNRTLCRWEWSMDTKKKNKHTIQNNNSGQAQQLIKQIERVLHCTHSFATIPVPVDYSLPVVCIFKFTITHSSIQLYTPAGKCTSGFTACLFSSDVINVMLFPLMHTEFCSLKIFLWHTQNTPKYTCIHLIHLFVVLWLTEKIFIRNC